MSEQSTPLLELSRQLLHEGRVVSFAAQGRSMVPFIRGGDTVHIGPVNRALKRGDVVFFQVPPGRPVLHRILRLAGDVVFARGDAWGAPIERVARHDVHGLLLAVEGPGRPLRAVGAVDRWSGMGTMALRGGKRFIHRGLRWFSRHVFQRQ